MTTPRVALITAVSLAAYLGLAIAGEGGVAAFSRMPPLVASTLVTVALGVASLFTEGHLGSGVREDRSNRWVIAALGVLGAVDAYLPAFTDRNDFLTIGGEGVRWLGVAVYAVGGVLRLAPVFVLGRSFSGLVAIQPDIVWSPARSTASYAIRATSGSVDQRARVGPGVSRRRRRHSSSS